MDEKNWERASGNKKMGEKLLAAVLSNKKIYDLSQELQEGLPISHLQTMKHIVLKSDRC